MNDVSELMAATNFLLRQVSSHRLQAGTNRSAEIQPSRATSS